MPNDDLTIPTEEVETIGISPKVVAQAIAGYVATLAAGFAFKALDVEIDVTALQAVLLPLVVPIVGAIAGILAKPGTVVRKAQ